MNHSLLFWFLISTALPLFGNTWEVVQSPTNNILTTIAYGNGKWLANGDKLYQSSNGTTWEEVPAPVGLPDPYAYLQLRFVGGRFLLVGAWKQSLDGQTWSDFPMPAGYQIYDILYANGRWVCTGSPGLFAWATTPGNWHVSGAALTSDSIEHVIYLGGYYHAFGFRSTGVSAFSSLDGETWTIQPSSPGVWLQKVQMGEIELPNGSIVSAAVGTDNSSTMQIGTASGDRVVWETRSRNTFGELIFRRSVDAGRPSGFRREWVNLTGPQVYTLSAANETPVVENRNTTNDFLAMAVGSDAMIAVGTGGLIRRFPIGPPVITTPNLQIRNAVELKWSSRAGASYEIQESSDMTTWNAALPTSLPGTGADMTWVSPVTATKMFYRVREF